MAASLPAHERLHAAFTGRTRAERKIIESAASPLTGPTADVVKVRCQGVAVGQRP